MIVGATSLIRVRDCIAQSVFNPSNYDSSNIVVCVAQKVQPTETN